MLVVLGSALFPELVYDVAVRPLAYRLAGQPPKPSEHFLWPDKDEVAGSAQKQEEPPRGCDTQAAAGEEEEDGERVGENGKANGEEQEQAAAQASGAGADGAKFQVRFVNKWKGGATSLFWVDKEGKFHMLVNSFVGPTTVSSFVGHRFAFTAEGTKDQVGETVTIRRGVVEYTLGDDARRLAEVSDPTRIEQVSGVPQDNYESLQLLQYEVGQYYKTHHDMSAAREYPDGPRILTFFLYLSDVDEGGKTNFPRAGPDGGIKVRPVKGSAVLWPSVLNEDPIEMDQRTYHAALPVIKGNKYAANHWLHSGNFRKAHLWGCRGSF